MESYQSKSVWVLNAAHPELATVCKVPLPVRSITSGLSWHGYSHIAVGVTDWPELASRQRLPENASRQLVSGGPEFAVPAVSMFLKLISFLPA